MKRFIGNHMEIHRITRTDLQTLEPLLLASYGNSEFALADEYEYFPEPAPNDWFWLEDAEIAIGFLRYFPAGKDLNVIEIYASNSGAIEILLEHFKSHQTQGSKLLRFDLKSDHANLETLVRSHSTVVTEKHFQRFELSIPSGSTAKLQPYKTSNLIELQFILCSLVHYSLERLQTLLDQGWLRLIEYENMPVAAIHLNPRDSNSLEVASLATHPDFLRRGFARALLQRVRDDAIGVCDHIRLQVNVDNIAAIRLYQGAGFKEIPQDRELWLYTRWD
jgi:GNAT superfamily N-acetyltransferase